jgi:hypothetical protein
MDRTARLPGSAQFLPQHFDLSFANIPPVRYPEPMDQPLCEAALDRFLIAHCFLDG